MSLETQSFEFGEFVLDTREKVLLRNQEPISITPKAFSLLQTLVENHGHILAKDQLMATVWANSFVEESNLTFTVNLLRKTLADSSQNPRYIETVPKRGYRFIAPVVQFKNIKPSNGLDELAPTPELTKSKTGASRLPKYLIPVLSVIIIGLLATGFWFATSSSREPDAPILSAAFSAEKLPTSGNSGYAVISPDGKYAAYTDESGGKQSVWLRHLENAENIQIVPPSDDIYFGLTLSNSGDSLFFVRKTASGHALPALYKVGVIGGVPVKLVENVIRPVGLSPDDKQISFIRCMYKKDDFCSLNIADVSGENEQKLFSTLSGVHIHDSRFSPDGKSIAFSWGRTGNDINDFRVSEVGIETGAQREILAERFFDIGSQEWLPNGSGLLFSANDYIDGKAAIWVVSTATGKISPLTKDTASYSKISLDKTGNKMIAVQQEPDFKINVLANGQIKALANARDLTFSNSGRIFYSTFDGEIWMVNQDGTEQRQLTNNVFAESSPRVAPDGRTVYFSSNEGGTRHVWRMNIDGTNRTQVTTANGGYPEFITSDGQYIFYVSASDGRLYKVSTDGHETLVHEKMLQRPAISPDGSLIAYFFLDHDKIYQIAVMRTENKEVVRTFNYGTSFALRIAWSADSKTLNYIADSKGRNFLWQASLDEKEPRLIADLGGEEIRYLAISPADNTFGYIRGKWNYHVTLLRGLK